MTRLQMGALALGLMCTSLGMYGAYEFAHKLEGSQITYLVLAAPIIAGAAALIPVLAERTWPVSPLKALLWWVTLLPAGAVVFFSAAERVHVAKAGAQAELSAFSSAADRANGALSKANAKLAEARADANKARGQKQCGPDCRTKLAAEAAAKADVDAAEAGLLLAQKKATTESPIQAPVWLLPAALDAVAFMAIWTGLTGWTQAPQKPVKRRRRTAKRKPRAPKGGKAKATSARAEAEALFSGGADGSNVIPLRRAQ